MNGNKVPNDCVNASSVNMFKNRIDRYLASLSTGTCCLGWQSC